ncbi:GntR family transcriptional regulator [Planctomicrobium sp. SH664]|uniref:GntR family transcriptional regulator n=1 Tax=Planctomicrobium sp. SH664 TaxID=3448125 RepID=UPI003F5BE9B1
MSSISLARDQADDEASRAGLEQPCSHGQRRQMVTGLLIKEIFHGRLKAGKHLVIKDLAERYQVSPTPIREALICLETIGIIDFVPNRGAVVRKVSAGDVREVAQVRRALECEATRLACGRLDLSQLHALAEEFRKIHKIKRRSAALVAKARKLDDDLHDLIAESCGNRFLMQELSRLKLLFRAFRDTAWEQNANTSDPFRCVEEAAEHLAILTALIEGNAKAACQAMSRHIRSGVRYWSRALPRT